jgi:hypothetical protein
MRVAPCTVKNISCIVSQWHWSQIHDLILLIYITASVVCTTNLTCMHMHTVFLMCDWSGEYLQWTMALCPSDKLNFYGAVWCMSLWWCWLFFVCIILLLLNSRHWIQILQPQLTRPLLALSQSFWLWTLRRVSVALFMFIGMICALLRPCTWYFIATAPQTDVSRHATQIVCWLEHYLCMVSIGCMEQAGQMVTFYSSWYTRNGRLVVLQISTCLRDISAYILMNVYVIYNDMYTLIRY